MGARNIQRERGRREGFALVYAVFTSFVAAGMVAVLLTLSLSSDRIATVKRYDTEAEYAALGGIEDAKKAVQTAIANFVNPPAGGQVTINGTPVTYTIEPSGFSAITTDPAGIQTIVDGFEFTSTATIQGYTSTAHRIVNMEQTPIFQFAVFYTNDLEIFPGPDMTLGGRVHSNQDIYLGSGATLTVDTNYLRSVGDIYRDRKDTPGASFGHVDIRKWVANPYDSNVPADYFPLASWVQMNTLGVSTTSGYDSDFEVGYDADGDGDLYGPNDWLPWDVGALEYWKESPSYAGGGSGHTVMTSDHGVTEAVTPSVQSIGIGGYYHDNAGLAVIADAGGTGYTALLDGADVTADVVASGAVTLKKNLYDARQANDGSGNISTIEIDVSALNTATTASGASIFPANGLLYASQQGLGTGTAAHGVVLTNGSELAAPLTVVSESSVYVHGDYNTVNKKGASVIGDAVSLLSNDWDFSKSKSSGLPDATDTTFNVAIITGNHDSSVGTYNGGLENLPRFHERWSGEDCRINGSFVNTWTSQYATGTWKYGGSRYTAPNRDWTYDTAFNNVANLPPFTPLVVIAEDVASW